MSISKKLPLLLLCLGCQAQVVDSPSVRAIRLQGVEWVVPQLIIGGEWTSRIRLTNRGVNLIPVTNVLFVDNLGNPMSATFQTSGGNTVTDTGFSFSLGPGGLIEILFMGGANAQFGHGIVGCSSAGCGTPGLYGDVSLKNSNPTRPDFESVFPLEEPAGFQYMLFDGRNGFTTTLYLVNDATTATTISVDVVDASNHLIRTVNIPMGSLTSQILTLHVIAPETIGIQGTLAIHGPNGTGVVTATGLRINPTNSFTPIRGFVPSN